MEKQEGRRFIMKDMELRPEDRQILLEVTRVIKNNSSRTTVIEPKRYQDIRKAKERLDRILLDAGQDRSRITFQTVFCSASLDAEFDNFVVFDMKMFQYVIQKADNFEIYPLTNGKVRMSFAFNQVLIPIR